MRARQIFLILFFLTCSLSADNIHVVRAAIDIGMGGPKLQVAEVDLSKNKIVKILHTQRFFVNFYESISQNENHRLDPETMIQGLNAIKQAIAIADAQQAQGIVLIATASLRSAVNGNEFALKIQNETGIFVHIVDQTLEGQLAFQAVLSKTDIEAENLVVWDIGGGSIQFIGSFQKAHSVDCGKEGVGAFNDYIIGQVQGKNTKNCISPNPMSKEDILQAGEYARYLSQKVDKVFRDKIVQSSTKVVGAGSVFGYGIANMVSGKNPFSVEDLAQVVSRLPGKTDADLGGGDFAFCEGSNTILALGFMQALGISQVYIANVNNADGALIYAPFWNNR